MTGPVPPDRPRRWPRILAGAALFVFVGAPLILLAFAVPARFSPGGGIVVVLVVVVVFLNVLRRVGGPDVALGCVIAGALTVIVGGGVCFYAVSQMGY